MLSHTHSSKLTMATVTVIKTLVKEITTLSNSLPLLVQQATKDNKIWSIVNTDQDETAYETFNQHFDAMFREDCRNFVGHLQHVPKGKFGMNTVCLLQTYQNVIEWTDSLWILLTSNSSDFSQNLGISSMWLILSSFLCIAADFYLAIADLKQNWPSAHGHHAPLLQHSNSQTQTMLLSPSCRSNAMPYKPFTCVLKMPHLHLQGHLFQNPLMPPLMIFWSDHLPSVTHLLFLAQDTQNPNWSCLEKMMPVPSLSPVGFFMYDKFNSDSLTVLWDHTTVKRWRITHETLNKGMYHTNIPFLILKLDAVIKTHATLGNPTDVDEDSLLMDINVQQVHDDVPMALRDRRWDIDHFFNPPIPKTVNGNVKKYCGCKLCL